MAVEDGAVIGALFERLESLAQMQDVLIIYERLRKARTSRVVRGSAAITQWWHMEDGDRQRERDRQMTEDPPFEGCPNFYADRGCIRME